jgi:chromosome segregation ATPase
MQTMTFTDDKLEERFDRYDERFDRIDERLIEVNQRITEHKEETSHRFDRVESDICDLKKSVDANTRELRTSIDANTRDLRTSIDANTRDLKEGDIGDLKRSVEALQKGLGSVQESVAAVHTTLTRLSIGFAIAVLGAILTKGF